MRSGSVLLTALLLTGFATTTAAAEPTIARQGCEKNKAVDCATVTVPIDYAHPATGTIDVHIARIPATSRKHPVRCDAGLLANLPNVVPDAGARLAAVPDLRPRPAACCSPSTAGATASPCAPTAPRPSSRTTS